MRTASCVPGMMCFALLSGLAGFEARASECGPPRSVAYGSGGYRFQVVKPEQASDGFEAVGFDDSEWAVAGPHGLGSPSCCGCPEVGEGWPLDTDVLVRQTFLLPRTFESVEVGIAVDNDLVDVFVNGERLARGLKHEGCAAHDSYVFEVPRKLLIPGRVNVLAVRARDRGGMSYYDHRISVLGQARGGGKSLAERIRRTGPAPAACMAAHRMCAASLEDRLSDLVESVYRSELHRGSDAHGKEDWMNWVGRPGAKAGEPLDAIRAKLVINFRNSAEYQANWKDDLQSADMTDVVESIFVAEAGRPSTANERGPWLREANRLRREGRSKDQIRQALVEKFRN